MKRAHFNLLFAFVALLQLALVGFGIWATYTLVTWVVAQ